MAVYLTSASKADTKNHTDYPNHSQSSGKDVPLATGFTNDEARCQLEKFGLNAVLPLPIPVYGAEFRQLKIAFLARGILLRKMM